MRVFLTLVRRELGGYFASLTGYLIIAMVALLVGLSFTVLLEALSKESYSMPVTDLFYSTPFFWLVLLLAAPVITMRSFAQELYSGTYETLMTTPVGDLQVVLAKFTSSMISTSWSGSRCLPAFSSCAIPRRKRRRWMWARWSRRSSGLGC